MLDAKTRSKRTAERLKASLHTAFDAWAKKDPRVNTKAELARRLSQLASPEKCTPQTVGGWFSTGRMDKKWIKLVESLLGVALDYDLAEVPAQPPLLAAAPMPVEEIELLSDFRELLPEERDEWRQRIAARARQMRAHNQALLQRMGVQQIGEAHPATNIAPAPPPPATGWDGVERRHLATAVPVERRGQFGLSGAPTPAAPLGKGAKQ